MAALVHLTSAPRFRLGRALRFVCSLSVGYGRPGALPDFQIEKRRIPWQQGKRAQSSSRYGRMFPFISFQFRRSLGPIRRPRSVAGLTGAPQVAQFQPQRIVESLERNDVIYLGGYVALAMGFDLTHRIGRQLERAEPFPVRTVTPFLGRSSGAFEFLGVRLTSAACLRKAAATELRAWSFGQHWHGVYLPFSDKKSVSISRM
jgi:hypothetical protein